MHYHGGSGSEGGCCHREDTALDLLEGSEGQAQEISGRQLDGLLHLIAQFQGLAVNLSCGKRNSREAGVWLG
jgi:hypothetical protein